MKESKKKGLVLMEVIIIFLIIGMLIKAIITMGQLQTPISEIDNCVGVCYEELNAGTFTTIIQSTDQGLVDHLKYRGKYICNADKTVSFESIGTINK